MDSEMEVAESDPTKYTIRKGSVEMCAHGGFPVTSSISTEAKDHTSLAGPTRRRSIVMTSGAM